MIAQKTITANIRKFAPAIASLDATSAVMSDVQGQRPGEIVRGKFAALPWRFGQVFPSEWRQVRTGEKVLLKDQIASTYFFINQVLHVRDLVRIDVLPPMAQLEWGCWRLNWLQSSVESPTALLEIDQELRGLRSLAESLEVGLVLDAAQKWSIQPVKRVAAGQRVKIVGVQDSALLHHIGGCGTVVPFREYVVPGACKVRVDGFALDLVLPTCCVEPMAVQSGRLKMLQAEYEALSQARQHILDQGDILTRKPEVFATVKRTRTVCGNVQSEHGAKGYAFMTTVQNGRRKRRALTPAELPQAEAAYQRGLQVRQIDRELKRLRQQIDRAAAIAHGNVCLKIDPTGKTAGQLDIHDTRDTIAGPYPYAKFSFVVFRWELSSTGGLRRGKALRKFSCPTDATPAQIEAVRQRAIAFLQRIPS